MDNRVTIEDMGQVFQSIEKGCVCGREDSQDSYISWEVEQISDKEGTTALIKINKWMD